MYQIWIEQAGILCFLCPKHSIQEAPVLMRILSHYHAVNYLMKLQADVFSLNAAAKPPMAMILITLLPHCYYLCCYASKDFEYNLKWLRFSHAVVKRSQLWLNSLGCKKIQHIL